MATEATDQRRRRKAFPQGRDPGPAPADGPDPQTKAPRPPSPGGVPRGHHGLAVSALSYKGSIPALEILPTPQRDRPGRPVVMVAGRGLRCRAGPARLTRSRPIELDDTILGWLSALDRIR